MKPFLFAFAALFATGSGVLAHEGDVHEEQRPPALSIPLAPRAEAATDQIELLAVLDGGVITLYVDRFAGNEPVVGARVEVQGEGIEAVAAETSPGVYAFSLPPSTSATQHALTVSVEAGQLADLLTVTIGNAELPGDHRHQTTSAEWTAWATAGAVLLAGAALVVARRLHFRRRRPGRKP